MKHENVLNFKSLLYLFIITIIPFTGFTQEPTTQDCLGAIAVCDDVYEEENTASGYGNYFEIPNGGSGCPNNHCMDGEKNSRWYIFTVVESGDLKFQITPSVNSDDYDWAVFDLSSYHCEDIWDKANLIMSSCNAAGGAGYQGTTGISTANGGDQDCENGGFTNKWNADLPVYEGETYVLVVSDWTQTPGGYTLNFSTSTASIFDDQKPYIDYIGADLITDCGTNELSFSFNENVKCSSVSIHDFKITGPGGPYTLDSLYGENCELGGSNERDYILYFSPPIDRSGDYTLEIKNLSFISDACNNYADAEVYEFTIDLDSPEADAGADIDIAYGGSTTIFGDASGGSGNYTFHWEPADLLDDADIQTPTTVSLTASTEFTLEVQDDQSNCVGTDKMWVNVVGGPLGITLDASATVICSGDLVGLYAYPDGGSGNYTYSWTSDPVGFTSTEQNPSDYPSVTTTYFLEITDGFTTLNSEITIQVNPKPVADAGADQTINEGSTTILDGSGAGGSGNYIYQWEPASLLVQNDIPNPQTTVLFSPTLFTLIIEDENGCFSEPDNVLVITEGPALAAFPLADPSEICSGESVSVSANATGGGGEYTYAWTSDPPGFSSTSPSFVDTPDQSIRYDLLLTDQHGSEFTGHINVTVHQKPVINLIPDHIIPSGQDSIKVCVRDTLLLDAGQDSDPPGSIYFWDNNFEGRHYLASTNGNWIDFQTHEVFVKHGVTGCENSEKLTIIFDFNECEISIPENNLSTLDNVKIQPNPNNGQFTLMVNEDITDLTLKIIDVCGRLVFADYFPGKMNTGFKQLIEPGNLEKGLYFIHLETSQKQGVRKVIVQ